MAKVKYFDFGVGKKTVAEDAYEAYTKKFKATYNYMYDSVTIKTTPSFNYSNGYVWKNITKPLTVPCGKCGFAMNENAIILFRECVGEVAELRCVPCWRSSKYKIIHHYLVLTITNEAIKSILDHGIVASTQIEEKLKDATPYFRGIKMDQSTNFVHHSVTLKLTAEFRVPLDHKGVPFDDSVQSVSHGVHVLESCDVYDLWPHLNKW